MNTQIDKKKITDGNREAWNEALGFHRRARDNRLHRGFASLDFTVFDFEREGDVIAFNKLREIDFKGKTIAQLPCNNGSELLSLMRFGAEEGAGFDISDAAIAEARELQEISGLNVSFERINILEIGEEHNGRFDFIYITEGSLQWFPCLNEYFGVVARLLKKGGQILIFEMHPFSYFFENGFDPKIHNFTGLTSYFDKGPYSYKEGLDYVGGTEYEAKECFWFMHKLSDIFTALRENGIEVREFHEYNFDVAGNKAVEFIDKFPLSYMLTGEKR